MTAKSHGSNKSGFGKPPEPAAETEKPRGSVMPPAGPHAEPHLTNPDATPGTGALTKTDHGEVETDPGGG